MKTSPGRQDGIAALRQRLFFANELLKLAERELAGDAPNRHGAAMACRNSAVLQLHAVLTGMLDDVAGRLRVPQLPESLAIADLDAALRAKGMASPELNRVVQLAGSGWLAGCIAEARLCLSATPVGVREAAGHDRDPDHHRHEPVPAGGRIDVRVVAADAPVEVLSGEDFARIRRWIAGWQSLLDEFLVTLDEF